MIKQFALIIALLLSIDLDITKIARANKLKKEAERAYMDLNYKEAAAKYRSLIDDLGETSDHAVLNLAHSYYNMGQLGNAVEYYNRLITSENRLVKSIALQQLGILAYRREDYDRAVAFFKESLRADHQNEEARYNYELLKKKKLDKKIDPQDEKNKKQQQQNQDKQQQKEEKQQEKKEQNQPEQQPQDQPQPQQNPDSQSSEQSSKTQPNQEPGNKQQPEADRKKEDESKQNPQQKQDQQGKEQQAQDRAKSAKENGEQGENQARNEAEQGRQEQGEQTRVGVNKQQLEKMNLTEDKARMILDAMRSNEIQYIQQMQHKGTSKKPEKGKPDW